MSWLLLAEVRLQCILKESVIHMVHEILTTRNQVGGCPGVVTFSRSFRIPLGEGKIWVINHGITRSSMNCHSIQTAAVLKK
jgi:hypothetical protein